MQGAVLDIVSVDTFGILVFVASWFLVLASGLSAWIRRR